MEQMTEGVQNMGEAQENKPQTQQAGGSGVMEAVETARAALLAMGGNLQAILKDLEEKAGYKTAPQTAPTPKTAAPVPQAGQPQKRKYQKKNLAYWQNKGPASTPQSQPAPEGAPTKRKYVKRNAAFWATKGGHPAPQTSKVEEKVSHKVTKPSKEVEVASTLDWDSLTGHAIRVLKALNVWGRKALTVDEVLAKVAEDHDATEAKKWVKSSLTHLTNDGWAEKEGDAYRISLQGRAAMPEDMARVKKSSTPPTKHKAVKAA